MDKISPVNGSAPSRLSTVEAAHPVRPARGARRPVRWWPALSGRLAAAFVTAFTAAVLIRYGVSGTDLALFAIYVVLGLALPGVLAIRALYRAPRTWAEEIALGLAFGYAVEILVYIGARAVGMPLLVAVWPLTTYALFLAVPSLRGHWRAGSRPATPLWWSWALALVIALLVGCSALKFFGTHAITWPGLGASAPDMPFHLALIGELKHHVPPSVPMVVGEPLAYHWFVYAHLAAASWLSGVEPLVLLYRLGMLPMLAAFVVLAGMTGRRVTGSWIGGVVTLVGTIFVGAPSLYLGTNGVFTWGGVPDTAWISPTQTLGALLFAPLVLLLVDLLERRWRDTRTWLLAGLFLVVLTGAKATYLPLLGAGLLVVAAVDVMRRRRPSTPVLILLGMTAACVLFAQFFLFGQERQGLVTDPLSFMRGTWSRLTGLTTPSPGSTLALTLVYLLCWAVTWSGILGLLSRPKLLMRPRVSLMLGMGAAGLGAVLLLGHPGQSQLFFFWGAYPYLAAVAAYGILILLRRARVSPKAVVCSMGAGLVAAYLIPILCGVKIPLGSGQEDGSLYRPYLTLVALTVLAGLLLALLRGRAHASALVLVAFAAIGLPAYWHARVLSAIDNVTGEDPNPVVRPVENRVIPQGALAAGRWLRDHSEPDDLVATNTHCRLGYEHPCDTRYPWVAALSERHVLVEGWAYTATNLSHWRPGLLPEGLPFWDTELIKMNDTAFQSPSQTAMRRLRESYGVRWLFVDELRANPSRRIGDFAEFQFRSGDYAVYRLPDGSM
ncbi:hypothetical protein [Nonomuraea sp. NEAU-A123]|uniref:hypothetical protein n=1 Tax=Nonomuraea sp. NEAU-A123 TaxID=2839649 RepID=UPI001BE459DF|nr:hypothetical protein [Nonomuraea sp. NEAU-A123]MBT2231289.1 hypothetical protein [Nonomuraea sp. NEAU-A123]